MSNTMTPKLHHCFSLLCVLVASVAHAQAGERPNIVLILADDFNVDSIGCFGGDPKLTPNLD